MGCLHDIKATGEFFLSAFVVVEQGPVHDRSSKLRMCLSCRGTNEELPRLGLQMSTLERRRGEFKQGSYFTFIDITKGYFHVPLHRDYQRYVAFTWRGRVYFWLAAPFGLRILPAIFTDLVSVLVERWALQINIKVHCFILSR